MTSAFYDGLELDSSVQQTIQGGEATSDLIGNKSSAIRADEVSRLLETTVEQLISFVSRGNSEREGHRAKAAHPPDVTSLVNLASLDAETLRLRLDRTLNISQHGDGFSGFQRTLQQLFKHSVNPMAPGFMDKLYASPLPPGIAAELTLAVLNTNVHVYQVSPVLTLIEKFVTKRIAALMGLDGSRAGGVSVQGGSASNLTSIVVARNTLFPDTKMEGNSAGGRQLVIFTSAHGHYSIEKAAQGLGFGSSAVVSVPTDETGRMRPDELERLIVVAKSKGKTPFYINATAGTTVLGSFDPFLEISQIARKYRCWFHVDGAWGGSFIFSHKEEFRHKLAGIHLADSIAINPHKMLGVPLTCSLLLTRDLRLFQSSMTLKAGYLFHDTDDDSSAGLNHIGGDEVVESKDIAAGQSDGTTSSLFDLRDTDDPTWVEPNDLADMTLQCGRRADSLKFFICWQYYGTQGYASMIENAYEIAVRTAQLIDSSKDLILVLGPGSKPSCLQVCFYYTPQDNFVFGLKDQPGIIPCLDAKTAAEVGKLNTRITSRISKALIPKGFMIDFAPALEGQEDRGSFLRVVINILTIQETANRLIEEVLAVGENIVEELKDKAT